MEIGGVGLSSVLDNVGCCPHWLRSGREEIRVRKDDGVVFEESERLEGAVGVLGCPHGCWTFRAGRKERVAADTDVGSTCL
jgi:hypothetical protein